MQQARPFVLLITGPAGAGKSAAAAAWARRQKSPTAHISLDDVREYIVAGYADPRDGWNDETQRQYELARRHCVYMARSFLAAGMTCVIDDAIFPHWTDASYDGWLAELKDIPHLLIVLLPDEASVIERNAHRHGRRLLAPDMLHIIYEMMASWRDQERFPIIDTTTLAISEVALAIEHTVNAMRERGNSA